MKYSFKCKSCLQEFDKDFSLQHVLNHAKFPKVKCPVCDSLAYKVINPPTIHYKSRGFYVTDNPKEQHGKPDS